VTEPSQPTEGHEPEGATKKKRVAELRGRAAELERQATQRFERERARRSWVRIGWNAWNRDARQGGNLLAGGLAYRVFLWQLPSALFFISLLGVMSDLAGKDPAQAARQWGVNAAVATTVAKGVSGAGSGRWWLLILGGWLMLWAGRGAARAVVVISRIAWAMPPRSQKVSSTKASLVFTAFATGGIILQTVVQQLLSGALIEDIVAWVVVSVMLLALVTLALTLLPRRGEWTAVIPGALFFVGGSRLLGLGSSIYLAGRLDRVDDLYGGLGMAIVIMLWLYVSARLMVWGIFLNATLAGVGQGGSDEDASVDSPA
jgi:uncharacterized BrkB/YihY/UPF0761 family membrane protein